LSEEVRWHCVWFVLMWHTIKTRDLFLRLLFTATSSLEQLQKAHSFGSYSSADLESTSFKLCIFILFVMISNPAAIRKLMKEINRLRNEPPEGIRVTTNEDDMLDLTGIIEGPGEFY
jgi:hypothetical protein